MNRREFLHAGLLTAATVALAGCSRAPAPPLVSQALLPEFYLPGVARWFATTCGECANGCGLAVRVIGGRARKVEGLTGHPTGHGAHCLRADSALQALYHPERLQVPLRREGDSLRPADWDSALSALGTALAGARTAPGSTLIITGALRGARGGLLADIARRLHARIWIQDFPGTRVERLATASTGDAPRLPWLALEQADYVVDFGGDFLATGPAPVDAAHRYGRFRADPDRARRGILVSFASRMSLTVASSDRWIATRPGTEGWIAAAVATLLAREPRHDGRETVDVPSWARVTPAEAAEASGVPEDLILRLARRLRDARAGIAVGGYDNAAHAHGLWTLACIRALNRQLGGVARATWDPDLLVPPSETSPSPAGGLLVTAREAVEGLGRHQYRLVLVVEANPAFLVPSRFGLAALLAGTSTFAFGPFRDETADAARWVLPTPTWLEAWGDIRVAGPVSLWGVRQPVAVRPDAASGARPAEERMLEALARLGDAGILAGLPTSPEPVRDLLRARLPGSAWDAALARGGCGSEDPAGLHGYARPPMAPPPPAGWTGAEAPEGTSPWSDLPAPAPTRPEPPPARRPGSFVLVPYPSPVWHDGSGVNRPWIPEVADPLAQTVWGPWIEMPPSVAARLGIERGDRVRLRSDAGTLEGAALPLPTVHPEVLAMPVGLGRPAFGGPARGRGANPLDIVVPEWQAGTGEPVYASTPVTLERLDGKAPLVTYDRRVGGLARGLGAGSGIEERGVPGPAATGGPHG